MRFFAHRFAEKFLVQFLDVRVFVRLTERFLCVFAVDSLVAGFEDFGIAVVQRLSAAADATARTGHDLYRVEVIHPRPYSI